MICAVDICKRDCEFGDIFCPKHRRRFEKALAKDNENAWWRSNRVHWPKELLASEGGDHV